MAPTDHAAALRFTYPGDDASVVFDNVTDQAGLTLDKENGIVTGYSDVKSGLSTGATRLFVYGVFDAPVAGRRLVRGQGLSEVRRRATTGRSPCASPPR